MAVDYGGGTANSAEHRQRLNPIVPLSPSGVVDPVAPTAPAVVNIDPAAALGADPTYLAYMRAINGGNAVDEADANYQTASLHARLPLRSADIAQAGEEDREAISGGFESRGMFRSGAHEVGLARQRARQGRAESELNLDATDRLAGIHTGLSRARLGREQGLAEERLRAIERLLGGL